MTLHRPTDEKQVADIVAGAAAEKQTLEIVAGGSKRAFGRPVRADHVLDLSQIAGIVNYEAPELILTARPGTPLGQIQSVLRGKGQMLSFEPPSWLKLLESAGEPTLGGVLACNLSGPRRVRAGAARDFILGFSAVSGRGEIFKAGGKVVKNVTGFDLSKLMTGSFGTLAVLTEVTLKVMPRPQTESTVLLHALADNVAIDIMARALNTPFEVSGVAHLPEAAARRSSVAGVADGLGAVTAIRLEGPTPSVAYRVEQVEQAFGHGARLEGDLSGRFWEEVGEVRPLLPQGDALVWRLCPTPSRASALIEAIRSNFHRAEAFFDWGGGLVWLALDADEAGPDAGAQFLRATLKGFGGHATLVVAPESLREKTEVFEPEEAALAALTQRVKQNFDPMAVLNPGRIREGR
jgi:glycolate oxidase FAD binding subunit